MVFDERDEARVLESCYISEYQQLLEEALNCSVASDDPEELWGELRKAVIAARQVFGFPSGKPESDWTTDEMREISEISKKKARAWVGLKKYPNDPNLKVEYQRLKLLRTRLLRVQEMRGGRPKQRKLKGCMRKQ